MMNSAIQPARVVEPILAVCRMINVYQDVSFIVHHWKCSQLSVCQLTRQLFFVGGVVLRVYCLVSQVVHSEGKEVAAVTGKLCW